ncbi:MAG TPA: tetratricopeptide repeat protein, partial [Gemmatales bacterium]|nr:tetratricopeptide repeat protein [Gemmatales bacterium]
WLETQCWLLSDRKDYAQILALRTVELAPEHTAARILAIQLLLENSDTPSHQKALALAKQFEKPQNAWEPLYWQGRSLTKLGQLNDALACYRQVMELAPRFSAVYQATTELLLQSAKPEALLACQQVLNRWRAALPEDVHGLQADLHLAILQGKATAPSAKVEQFLARLENNNTTASPIQTVSTEDKNQSLNKQKLDALCIASQSLLRLQELEQAEALLRKALEQSPQHQAALLLLGDCLTQKLNKELPGSPVRRQLADEAIGY